VKKNIIHKVQVEINTTSMATANTVKRTMDEIIHTQILPSIEAILERYSQTLRAEESLQINTLDLDITINRSQLESNTSFLEIEDQLERIMTTIQRKKTEKKTDHFVPSTDKNQLNDIQYPLFGERSISTQIKQLESFFFFLRTGMKPWWISDSETMKKLIIPETIVPIANKDPELFSRLFIREIQSFSARKRLIVQFNDQAVAQLVSAAFFNTSTPSGFLKQLNTLPSLLNGVSSNLRITIWEVLLTQLLEVSEGKKTSDLLVIVNPIIRSINGDNNILLELEVTWKNLVEPIIECILLLRKEQKTAIVEIRKIFIKHSDEFRENPLTGNKDSEELNSPDKSQLDKTETANKQSSSEAEKIKQLVQSEQSLLPIPEEGMIFEHAGLVLISPFLKHLFTRTGLMDNNNQLTDKIMAAHVLHYVATGNEDPWEFDTTFEKYIVGIDFDEPLVKHCAISDTVKTEVKSLFQAVKDNWTPMQNSSDELLQYEYLQRPGKLIVDGQQHRLVMERKTQDILLDKLSWAISIVRFPWNKELLYVEW